MTDHIPDELDYLRREALLILGYDPGHTGELTEHFNPHLHADHTRDLQAAIGRCTIRKINERARKRR